jgi:hypothetical protein
MDSIYRSSRRGVLVTIAICSMLGGLVLVWHLLRPGVINVVPTAQLLILLGLFVLPVVTIGAWALDLKHARSAPAPRAAATPQQPEPRLFGAEQAEASNITHAKAPGRDAAGTGRGTETHRHRRAGDFASPARDVR